MNETETWRDRERLFEARVCYVCRLPIADAMGLYHHDLDLLAHREICAELVAAERRCYERSRQGRQRPAAEVSARLRALREQEGAE